MLYQYDYVSALENGLIGECLVNLPEKRDDLDMLQDVAVAIYSQPNLIMSSTAIYINNKNNNAI